MKFSDLINIAICVEIFLKLRWVEGIIYCPHCKSKNITGDGTYLKHFHKYYCENCKSYFNDKTGTIFGDSKKDMGIWFLFMYFMSKNYSTRDIAKELGIGENCAYRMAKLIRESLFAQHLNKKLSGVVESDEVYINAGAKGDLERGLGDEEKRNAEMDEDKIDVSKTAPKRPPRKRGNKKKGRTRWDDDRPPVIGFRQRKDEYHGPDLFIEVTRNASSETIDGLAVEHIEQGSTIYTDGWSGYNHLGSLGYIHDFVIHSQGEYAKDADGDGINEVHVNTAEGMWSLLRQWIRTHRGVCKDQLKYYVATFEFCHYLNLNEVCGFDRVESILEAIFLLALKFFAIFSSFFKCFHDCLRFFKKNGKNTFLYLYKCGLYYKNKYEIILSEGIGC